VRIYEGRGVKYLYCFVQFFDHQYSLQFLIGLDGSLSLLPVPHCMFFTGLDENMFKEVV